MSRGHERHPRVLHHLSIIGHLFSVKAEVPKILAGFYATIKKPLEILRCKPAEWCPGGTPGAGGHNIFLIEAFHPHNWGFMIHFDVFQMGWWKNRQLFFWKKISPKIGSRSSSPATLGRKTSPKIPGRNLCWRIAWWALFSVPARADVAKWCMWRLRCFYDPTCGCTAFGFAGLSKCVFSCQLWGVPGEMVDVLVIEW